jgi:hypothetical protein
MLVLWTLAAGAGVFSVPAGISTRRSPGRVVEDGVGCVMDQLGVEVLDKMERAGPPASVRTRFTLGVTMSSSSVMLRLVAGTCRART